MNALLILAFQSTYLLTFLSSSEKDSFRQALRSLNGINFLRRLLRFSSLSFLIFSIIQLIPIMNLKSIFLWFAPDAKKGDDGRDVFGSRATFVLCAMGGAVGLGNLLRFPSVVYNNYGLQFFVPYLIALFFVALPVLMLEIAVGTAYRGGCVLAWHSANKRAKGIGLAVVFNGYTVVTYYIPLLAWVMKYFRRSFQSPLPWSGQDLSE